MVAALIDGEDGKRWIKWLKAKSSAVSNLRKKLTERGLELYLQRWERDVAGAKEVSKDSQRKPGPKGISSADEWIKRESTDSEPVFELGLLLSDPDASIAVFAVRDRKKEMVEKMLGCQSFPAIVREIFAKPVRTDVHWTKLSVLDVSISGLLRHLTVKTGELKSAILRTRWPLELRDCLPDLRKNFGPDYEFFILVQGDVAQRSVKKWRRNAEAGGEKISSGNIVHASSANEFFERLASTIYTLRERWSCPGFLPLHGVLFVRAEMWAQDARMRPFIYECAPDLFEQALKTSALLWRYTAFFGGLFHMNRWMWSKLQWSEEFSLGVSSLRPRVEIDLKPQGGQGVIQGVGILPGIGYAFDSTPATPVQIDVKLMQRNLRGLLRRKKAAARFFYSTKRTEFSGWEKVVNPVSGDDAPKGFDHIPAVLIPRHFVATEETFLVPASELSAAAEKAQESGLRLDFTIDGEAQPCLVFYAPSLLASIRRAYEKNSYGDSLFELQRVLEATSAHIGGVEQASLPTRMAVRRLAYYRPSCWCLDAATNVPESPDRWRWEALAAIQENAKNEGVSFDFMPSGDDSVEQGFKDTLQNCDADFLLRGMSQEDRADADRLAMEWAERVKMLIKPLYDVSEPDRRKRRAARGLVIAAVEETHRRNAAARPDMELASWVAQVLEVFSANSRRVTRQVIEVAQRCSLIGVEPIAIVVEPVGSILARWSGFLGEKLKSMLIPRSGRKGGKLDDGNCKFQRNETGELISLVRALVQDPHHADLAREFAELAVDVEFDLWIEALAEISTQENGKEIASAVVDGLKLFRDSGHASVKQGDEMKALKDRFEELRRRISAAVKPQKPPNPGG